MDKRKYAKVNGWDLVKELGKQVDVSSQYVLPVHHIACDAEFRILYLGAWIEFRILNVKHISIQNSSILF